MGSFSCDQTDIFVKESSINLLLIFTVQIIPWHYKSPILYQYILHKLHIR